MIRNRPKPSPALGPVPVLALLGAFVFPKFMLAALGVVVLLLIVGATTCDDMKMR